MLLVDLGRRALDLVAWYSNEGLLPNHTLLWRPSFEWQLSFFFAASTPAEAAFGMLACAVAYGLLLVGYRTKLAQLASLFCVLSLHTRASFVGNGGDVVLGELALFTAFLPTGRRCSLDALIARKRAKSPSDVPHAGANARVVSLAVLGLTLQLGAIYLFNALNKTGNTWREGSVVHYMLFHSGIVTPLGDWVRGFITLRQSQAMTYFSWAVEAILPVLLFVPIALTRRVAVVLIVVLHTGFALFLNLGVFVPAMIAFGLHFVPAEDWDRLERFLARRGGAPAWLRAAREPFEKLAERLARKAPIEPSRAVARLRSRMATLREVAAGALVALLLLEVLLDNPRVTSLERNHEPAFVRAIASYLQFVQGWSMYAPDADKIDVNVIVRAVTADGRHVDPFNEAASPNARQPGNSIPGRLGQDNLFCAYALRIAGTPSYHQAFSEWILRYAERTGRAADGIVSFEAFEVRDEAPPPGGRQPRNTTVTRFLSYP